MKLFDTHTHTLNSDDCRQSIDELCLSAIKNGITGITVTDHADIYTYAESSTLARIRGSIADTEAARKKYAGRLEIYKGVELGDMYASTEKTAEIAGLTDYDALLGSVHLVMYDDVRDYYSAVSFDEKSFSEEKINGFLHEYFSLVRNMIERNGFDIVTHLTCPLRYICLKYGRRVSLKPFLTEIEDILRAVIEKELALEVNLSGFNGTEGEASMLMPNTEILRMYRSLGGVKITLGSDAHTPERVGNRFNTALTLLKELGFKSYFYYKNRVAQEVLIN